MTGPKIKKPRQQNHKIYAQDMSLRDHFAGEALNAILSSPHTPGTWSRTQVASEAYDYADFMMKVREDRYETS